MTEKQRQAFEQGFVEKCAEYGVDPQELVKLAQSYDGYAGISHQSYLPVAKKRDLTKAEKEEVERESKKWIPRIFQSEADSPAVMLSSPDKMSRVIAAIGALPALGAGAVAGHSIGKSVGGGAGIAAGAGAAALGTPSYLLLRTILKRAQRAHNRTIVDKMQRLPEGATIRDIKSDPVYQAGIDRRNATTRAMLLASAIAR